MKVNVSLLKRMLILGLCTGVLYAIIIFGLASEEAAVNRPRAEMTEEQKPTPFGFHPDSFYIQETILQPNQFLGDILSQAGIAYQVIAELAHKAEDVFSVKQLRSGKKIALVHRDSCSSACFFIYEPDPYRYVLFELDDNPEVKIIERNVETAIETASGVIDNSLWVSMEEEGHKYSLISKMEDALAWTIDFHHIHKGDAYKLVFERKYVDGKPLGIGKLLGAWFKSGDSAYYSVYYENDTYQGFYDPQGRPMKRAFLKAPVRYSRISSRFSYRRYHPVLKTYRGHYGTDYAAAYGTPIVAVANGTITKASYTKGNGNYVKIRHDRTYETQYLHMSRFARGIRPGVRVKQGQAIGYVGSTGLATGPHVCFRFWKNGKQVDHMRLNFPPPDPLPDDELDAFFEVSDDIIAELDKIPERKLDPENDAAGYVMLPPAP